MVSGIEFHYIIGNIFDNDVRGLYDSEQLQVNCPRCQKRDGLSTSDGKYNLEINTNKKVFKCWKCETPKFKGNLGYLIKLFGNSSYYELYKSYLGFDIDKYLNDGEDHNIEDIEDIVVKLPNEFILFRDIDINNVDHLTAYNYMVLDRKIPYEKIIKYNVGFCVTGEFGGRIIIPSYNLFGDVNYFTARSYLNHKNKYKNPKKDRTSIIFNENRINWDSTIYLVEGGFDMLSTPPNTIPLLGKDIYDKLTTELILYKPNVIVILDPDAINKQIEIVEKLKTLYGKYSNRIRMVVLENFDIDEINNKFGKNSVINELKKCRDISIDDIVY